MRHIIFKIEGTLKLIRNFIRMDKRLLYFIVANLCFNFLSAQEYIKETYQQEDGLPGDFVKHITPDTCGFIWAGTPQGMVSLQGNNKPIVSFPDDDTPDIQGIIRTKKMDLIAFTSKNIYNAFINFSTGLWEASPLIPDRTFQSPIAAYEDEEGSKLWIVDKMQLYQYDYKELKPVNIDTSDIRLVPPLHFIQQDTQIFICSSNGKLFAYQPETNALIEKTSLFKKGKIHTITKANAYTWHAGTENGLYEIAYQSETQTFSSHLLFNNTAVTAIAYGNKGQLIFGTPRDGLFTYSPRNQLPFTPIKFTESEAIHCIYTRNNDIWYGSNNGLIHLREVPFKPVNFPHEDSYVMATICDSSGQAYYAESGRLYTYKPGMDHAKLVHDLNKEQIWCLATDNDIIAMGTNKGFIYISKKGEITDILNVSESGTGISSLAFDQNHNLWICQLNDAWNVFKWDKLVLTNQDHLFPKRTQIKTIFTEPEGSLYFAGASPHPLFKLNEHKEEMDEIKIHLPQQRSLISLTQWKDTLYLGTQKGLYKFDGDSVMAVNLTRFNQVKITALTHCRDQYLWIGTPKGLIRLGKENKLLFNDNQGMPAKAISENTLSCDSKGNLYIGTPLGALMGKFNASLPPLQAPLIIQSEVSGLPISFFEGNRIRADKITHLTFAAPNYPERFNVYSYSLSKGKETQWTDIPRNKNKISLYNLSEGHYTLQVRSRLSGTSVWSEASTYSFTIYKQWYKKSYVLLLFYLILTLSIIFIIFYIRWKNKKEQLKLKRTIDKHTKELQERNEELVQLNSSINDAYQQVESITKSKEKLFSVLAHDLKSPFNALIGITELLNDAENELEEDVKSELIQELYQTSTGTFRLIENILDWTRSESGNLKVKPTNIRLSEQVQEALRVITTTANQKEISIETDIPEDMEIYADQAMVATILRNLLTNAVKFSEKRSKVRIAASSEGKFAQIAVIDQGIGIPPDKLEHLFNIEKAESTRGTSNEKGSGLGLLLCYEFARKNSGQLSVLSTAGKGSTFTLKIPLAHS